MTFSHVEKRKPLMHPFAFEEVSKAPNYSLKSINRGLLSDSAIKIVHILFSFMKRPLHFAYIFLQIFVPLNIIPSALIVSFGETSSD